MSKLPARQYRYAQNPEHEVVAIRWEVGDTEAETEQNAELVNAFLGSVMKRDESGYPTFVTTGMHSYTDFLWITKHKLVPVHENDYIVYEGDGQIYVYNDCLFESKYVKCNEEPVPKWYRKKTLPKAYALQYTGSNAAQIAKFIGKSVKSQSEGQNDELIVSMATLHTIRIRPDDYVVIQTTASGSNRICDSIAPAIFEKLYSEIVETEPEEPEEPEKEIKDPEPPEWIESHLEMDILDAIGKGLCEDEQ